jgi:hypothetical protein
VTRTNQSTFNRIDLRLSTQTDCLAVNMIVDLRAVVNTLFAAPPDPPRHRMMGRELTLSRTELRRRSEEHLRWYERDVSLQSLQPTCVSSIPCGRSTSELRAHARLTAATLSEAPTIRLYSERLGAVLSDAASPLLARQPRMPGAV